MVGAAVGVLVVALLPTPGEVAPGVFTSVGLGVTDTVVVDAGGTVTVKVPVLAASAVIDGAKVGYIGEQQHLI